MHWSRHWRRDDDWQSWRAVYAQCLYVCPTCDLAPYVGPYDLLFRQFFADKSANGSLTFGVGFAAKKVRQVSVFPSTTTPPSTSSLSQFTIKPSATKASATSTAGAQSSGSRLNVEDVGRCLKISIVFVSAIILTLSY